MRLNGRYLAALLSGLCVVTGAHAAESRWVASWASSPLEGKVVVPGVPPERIPPSPILKGTVRYRLPLSQGGTRLILRLTNEANGQPLRVGAVTVAIAAAGLDARPATVRTVTFGGQTAVTLPAGAPASSDAVDLSTTAARAVIVSVYLPDETQCPLGQRGIEEAVVNGTDATQQPTLSGASPTNARTVVSAILVSGGPGVDTVVALGDSITDGGVTDTPDVRGWPGHLAVRLQGGAQGRFAVANEGIGGNRLLHDAIGLNALGRFDRDVLSLPNVSHVIVLEGINDIGFSSLPDNASPGPPVDAAALIAAYQQLIARAHLHGIRVIGGTLLPFKGAMYYSAAGDRTRQAVNDWIRSGAGFDAVVDFDRALRDPADPDRLAAGFDSGDHLHPSDAGYKAMANAFQLREFTASSRR